MISTREPGLWFLRSGIDSPGVWVKQSAKDGRRPAPHRLA